MTDQNYVKQNFLACSPFAITEVGLGASTLAGIYQGKPEAVSAGFPATGIINFLRAGQEDIGEAATNMQRAGSFDWLFDVESIGFRMCFPRSLCDGCDIRDIDGAFTTDPLTGRKLASRYTRLAELYFNNSRLVFQLVETKIVDTKLTWIGSGPAPVVEGLSVQHGPGQDYTVGQTTVSPSVAAFSLRTGQHGRRDLWNVGKVRIEELRNIKLYTQTDPTIVAYINSELLKAGFLYEDAAIGIRLKAYLFGPRTKKANYGAV